MTPGAYTLTTPTYGGPAARPAVKARYDAARTTDRNRRHWANADALGPVRSHSPEVRRVVRNRARYERSNNGYINGLVETLAHDLVGTGPRLQLDVGDRAASRRVERAFLAWCRAADLADKLRVGHEASVTDGEVFGAFALNDRIRHAVKLDVRLVEAERVASPPGVADRLSPGKPGVLDGIEYDGAGNPTRYSILREHPGDGWAASLPGEADWYPADRVVHWFRPRRPGELRGISRLVAALELAPNLRRFTLATVVAAETAASFAGVMQTDLPADAVGTTDPGDGDGGVAAAPGETFQVNPGTFLTLPAGQKAEQLKAEHPTTTYPAFKAELLGEMGRGLNVPFNTVSGNSSGYNFSSSRLDHLIYHRSIWIERGRMRSRVLDPLFLAWLAFAAAAPELDGLFAGLPSVSEWAWDWHWDGFAPFDPVKDATAAEARLRMGLTTRAEMCAADGTDWQETLEQLAAEREQMAALGLDPDPAPAAPADAPADGPAADPQEAADAAA